MALGVVLHPDYVHGPAAAELARLAEQRGLDSLWVPETWGRDAVTYLTQLALATTRIQLGTGVSPIFSRSPGLLAQTA
ncbi:MAG TPA: LLM class flavin-dependent oxidoreductase, partial [Chloroflexota bacterium]|nr:LLM class flavin-dependent oxidoreductase [Chloroflexota bacterium]